MATVRSHGSRGTTGNVKLAPGIALRSEGEPLRAMLLDLTAGEVHLNGHALAILELCDGSRSRDRVIADAMQRSTGSLRTADVADFLEAARLRGWIIISG